MTPAFVYYDHLRSESVFIAAGFVILVPDRVLAMRRGFTYRSEPRGWPLGYGDKKET